jgi:hypothetical protein
LTKLSAEILKISLFAKPLYLTKNNDQAISFLISLDFLIKGFLSHFQVKLLSASSETSQGLSSKKGAKSALTMKGIDIKFPLLIGD